MMTGKELIIYILENDLVEEEIFPNLFMSEIEAAIRFDVGISTIRAWVKLGMIKGIVAGDAVYILKNSKDPRKVRKGQAHNEQ